MVSELLENFKIKSKKKESLDLIDHEEKSSAKQHSMFSTRHIPATKAGPSCPAPAPPVLPSMTSQDCSKSLIAEYVTPVLKKHSSHSYQDDEERDGNGDENGDGNGDGDGDGDGDEDGDCMKSMPSV